MISDGHPIATTGPMKTLRGAVPVTVCQILFSLHVGGAEVLAARMARRLREAYRIIFACLDDLGPLGEELRAEGIPVHVLGRRPGIDWGCARRLGSLLRRERVDVVHAHQYGPFFYSALGRLPTGSPPLLLTEHGRSHPDPIRPLHRPVNSLLLRRRDRLVAVGDAVRRALIEVEGFPARRVEVIPNGVDLSAFAGCDRSRMDVRNELDLADGDLVIVQVARMDPLKDHETALRMLERILAHRADARLVLVGDGPRFGPIGDLVRERGLAPYVRLLGSRTDVPRLLGAADIALLTSLSEGIPLSLIEAMAAGLPVVATRVGGVPEVVEDGCTGLLAPAGDSDALSEQALRLAGNPGLRGSMAALARNRAAILFSEDRMCEAYNRAYREMGLARVTGYTAALHRGS